jgi:hypothetical protein
LRGIILIGGTELRTQVVFLLLEGVLMQVTCPHCNAVLLNDATTASRVVSCFVCKQLLQMPPLEPIPADEAGASTDRGFAIDTGSVAANHAKRVPGDAIPKWLWAVIAVGGSVPILLVLAILLSSPGTPPPDTRDDASSSRPSQTETVDRAESPGASLAIPLSDDVVMQLQTDSVTGRPVVRGTTNLPPGTELIVSISDTKTDGRFYHGQFDCSVKGDGTFRAGPFSNRGSSLEGEYVAEVTMPIPKTQPASVQAVIGANGEHLKGPLVKPAEILPNTVVVQVRKSFAVGGEDAVAEQEKRQSGHLAQCRAVYQELAKLAQELDDASQRSFTLAEWGSFIRGWNARVNSIRDRIDKLERSPASFHLGVAAGDLAVLAPEVGRQVIDGDTGGYNASLFRESMENAQTAMQELTSGMATNSRTAKRSATPPKESSVPHYVTSTGESVYPRSETSKRAAYEQIKQALYDPNTQHVDEDIVMQRVAQRLGMSEEEAKAIWFEGTLKKW